MSRVDPTEVIAHWSILVAGMRHSSDTFYAEVARRIDEHQLKDTKLERVNIHEGGMFSAKREYLQVRRDEYVFHVCAAPFGNGFFVSWWFGSFQKGFLAWLEKYLGLGFLVRSLVKPWTYYRVDTAHMFNAITSGAVEMAIDSVVEAQGLRALSPEQRKPVMKELLR